MLWAGQPVGPQWRANLGCPSQLSIRISELTPVSRTERVMCTFLSLHCELQKNGLWHPQTPADGDGSGATNPQGWGSGVGVHHRRTEVLQGKQLLQVKPDVR